MKRSNSTVSNQKPGLARLVVRHPDPGRLERTLIGLYVSGGRGASIRLRDADPAQVLDGVDAVLARLQGASRGEIAEDTLEVSFRPEPVEAPFSLIEGMHRDTQEVLDIATDAVREPLPVDARRRLDTLEERSDRTLFRLLRAASQTRSWSPATQTLATDAAERLERISDYGHRVVRRAGELSHQERVGVIADRISRAISDAKSLVSGAHEALRRPDLGLGHRIVERSVDWSQALEEDATSFAQGPSQPGQLPSARLYRGYFSILEDVQRIGLYAKSIAESGIDRATGTLPDQGDVIAVDTPATD